MSPRGLAIAASPARQTVATSLPDLWREDIYLAPVGAALDQIQLLSLDVFDTLLLRTCERPEDVFHEVGRRAVIRGWLASGVGPGEFAALREASQHHNYASLGREPRLEDIYERMPEWIGPRAALQRLEEEVEAELCVLNPSIASLVGHCRERNIRVVLVSDMYLGEGRVRSLLARAGFDTRVWTDRVLVSVDEGGYKMTGALYEQLAGCYPDVPRDAMLHIGDNVQSDVRAARAAGLRAVHYDMVRHDPDGSLALEQLVCGSLLPELSTLRRLAASLSAGVPTDHQAWHRVGAGVVGPFMSAFVEWALDQCEAEGIDLIAPMMREGHMLAPMLTRAARARRMKIDVTPLYVSRQAVALAGASDSGGDLMTRLIDHRRHMCIEEIFGLVGLDVPADLESHRNTQVTSAQAVLIAPGRSLRAAVVDALHTPEAQVQLARLVADERVRLVRYLDQVSGRHRAMATLDIGFYASIQRSIETALKVEGCGLRTMHLLGFGHGPVRDHVLYGMDIRTFAGSYATGGDLVKTVHRSAPVLEQLLQGPEGSTTGYAVQEVPGCGHPGAPGEALVVPVREENPLPASELASKAVVQAAMHRYQELWLNLRRARPQLVSQLVARQDAWGRVAHRLIDVPSYAEVAAVGSLHDDVNFGSRAVLPFCPADVRAQVAWTGADRVHQGGTAAVPAVWPQGVIASTDPGAVVARHAVSSSRPYAAPALALARALRQRGIARVVGYGTGDVARAFIDAARIMGVEVTALVDSNRAQHGLRQAGIEVTSLDDAVARGVHVYVVLSVAHADPISNTIRQRYSCEPTAALVLTLNHLLP
jgi:FMN phosphatase YigB (HAD superfamily)